MTLRKAMDVVAKLAEIGAIENYAIAGAVAALNYTQPTLTEDLDILVSVNPFAKHSSGLLLLSPIEGALATMGYREKTDLGYLIEDWPVQFLPAASELDEEALDQAIRDRPPLARRTADQDSNTKRGACGRDGVEGGAPERSCANPVFP